MPQAEPQETPKCLELGAGGPRKKTCKSDGLGACLDQCHNGLRGNAFLSSGKAKAFGGGGFDGNPVRRNAGDLGQSGLHGGGMGRYLGPFTDKSDIYVIDFKS
jgi:hypothetical protein